MGASALVFNGLMNRVGRRRGLTVITAALSGGVASLGLATPAVAAGPGAHVARLGAAPASQQIELVLPLVADRSGLERFARAVSTPGSTSYGQYESIGELASRFGAKPRAQQRVLAYLRSAGATAVRIDRTGLFADATVSAGLARRLFATPLAQFRTASGARFVAPTATARIPAGLRGLVTAVVGLDTRPVDPGQFASRPAHRAIARAASHPSSVLPRTGTVSPNACAAGAAAGEFGGDPRTAGFTPNQYLTAYGFDPLLTQGYSGQGERVALIEIDGFKGSDILTFGSCFHLHVPKINAFGVGSLRRKLPPGGEATLDLEVLDAAAPGLRAIDVYESKPSAAETLRALTAPLQNRGYKPQVISASLGLCEEALFGSIGPSGIRDADSALAMATASGITFLASSGDQGSADCTSLTGAPIGRLAVNYPASSWWVTGVGGTNFALNSANQITGQLVWNDTNVQPGSAGGGGLSSVFRRAFYQTGTVSQDRRAVPDVSMLADVIPGYAIYCSAPRPQCDPSSAWTAVGGTSAGTPLLAGAFAIVDQDLRVHKRSDLGLVNPLIYAIGRSSLVRSVFSDVLNYDNDIGPDVSSIAHSLGCCQAGPGFDEASGWGSVNVASFANVALVTQPARQTLSLPRGQRPVRSHKLLATLRCSLGCRMGAFAEVRIGHTRPFEVQSRVFVLSSAGRKTVPIAFSSRQLRKLRSALHQRKTIKAEIFGVLLNANNEVVIRTDGKQLTIRS